MNREQTTKSMPRNLTYAFVLCVSVWCWLGTGADAWAGDCGTRLRPSRSSSCTCAPKSSDGVVKVRRRGSRAACLRQAQKKARTLCSRKWPGARVIKGKLLSSRRACGFRYRCVLARRKRRGVKVSRRVLAKRGTKRARFKYRIGRGRRPCARVAKRIKKRVCSRSATQRPVRFSWRKKSYRVRFIMGFKKGYCTLAWICRYKRSRPAYWCQ